MKGFDSDHFHESVQPPDKDILQVKILAPLAVTFLSMETARHDPNGWNGSKNLQ